MQRNVSTFNAARLWAGARRRLRALEAWTLEFGGPNPPQPHAVDADFRVLFVCHGNICRSAMAEGVLRSKLAEVGAFGRIAVDSAGTSDNAAGRRPDGRARATVRRHGGNISDLRTRALVEKDFDVFDLILVMDESLREEVTRRAPLPEDAKKVKLLLDYSGGGEIRDPVHGTRADFERVYGAIERACDALVAELVDTVVETPPTTSTPSLT